MMSERVKGIGSNSNEFDGLTPSSTVWAVGGNTGGSNADIAPLRYQQACQAAPTFRTSPRQGGRAPGSMWWVGYPSQTRYTHVMPPNSKNCGFGGDAGGGAYSAQSRHPGVVNVLFADGSVKSIKGTVAVNTWWALGTRSAGEVVSSDSF
ncbi:MAG: DUF1559 domain-containing protein, partial [Planctomycetia bacterium]|nr:DUF1559 domain-containing protein [Planctomycetia bacterium]